MDRLSKTADIIRAAAEQIHLEDRLSSTDAFVRVSEEIAQDRGMTSPIKKRPDMSQLLSMKSDSQKISASSSTAPGPETNDPTDLPVLKPAFSEFEVTAPSLVENVIEAAAVEFMANANIKPNPVTFAKDKQAIEPVDNDKLIAEDANALNATITKKDKARTAAKLAISKNSYLQDHYFGDENTINGRSSLHEKSRTTTGTNVTISTSLSSLGTVLSKKGGVSKSQTEAMFRNMKSVSRVKENAHPAIVRLAKAEFSVKPDIKPKQQRPKSASDKGEGQDEGDVRLSKEYLRKIDDRLATPKQSSSINDTRKASNPELKYALYDEVENCTFRPKLTSSTAESKNDKRNDDDKNNFIQRQEATARNRREELEFNMGQAEYQAKIDKKVCPVCGAKQSYDEVKEKRKQCPNCKVDYARKITWNKVGKQFFDKTKAMAMKAAQEKRRIKEEVINESKLVEKRVFDKELGKIVVTTELPTKSVWNEETEKDFFERMAKKLLERDQKTNKMAEIISQETCTFKPHIEVKREKALDSDDEEEEDESGGAAFRRFIHRVDADISERRQRNPERYATKKVIEISQFKV